MRKLLSVLLSLLLVITLLPPIQAAASEKLPMEDYGVRTDSQEAYQELLATEQWDEVFKKKTDVALNHEWKINFSDIVKAYKIKAITIEHGGEIILPTKIEYFEKVAKVTFGPRLLGGKDYTMKILLSNGKKYKMDFTTTKEGADIEPNNKYQEASTIYVNETIHGSVSGTDTTDFYEIRIPENGQLDIKLQPLGTSELSLYLYDGNGIDGDTLAYKEKQKSTISLKRELKAGKYYIQVTGKDSYELTTSFTQKVVDPAKLLQEAQDAVNRLPAPVDVMGKHAEAINQALTKIATAKLAGADRLAIEKLEKTIAKLQDIIQPLTMTVTVFNSTTFEIRFNRAVDASVAQFEVDNGDGVTVKAVTFNANRTVAKVEMTGKLSPRTYTLIVNGVDSKILTGEVPVKPETVAHIEILGDTAIRIASDKVSIGYKVENQYSEDITGATTLTSTPAGVFETKSGKVTLTTTAKEGETIELTLEHVDTKITAKKVLTVTTQASITDISIKGIYIEDPEGTLKEVPSETLTETTDLGSENYHLWVEGKNQYGVVGKEALNVPNLVQFEQTNPSTITISREFKLVDDKTVLELSGTPKAGKSKVTLTAGKAQATYTIEVAEAQRANKVKFGEPVQNPVIEDEKLVIPIEVLDKNNNPIEDLTVVNHDIRGIKVTSSQNGSKKHDVVAGIAPDEKMYIIIAKDDVKAGELTLTAAFSSGTNAPITYMIDVEEKAIPSTIEILAENEILKITKDPDTSKIVKEEKMISAMIATVKDQFGREMSGTPEEIITEDSGYSLSLSYSDANKPNRAVEFGKDKVIAKAVGTEKVIVNFMKGSTIINSSKPITFTVTDGSDYEAYKIEKIETIYDALEAKKLTKQPEAYARDVIVLGILKNGAEVRLDYSAKDYEFEGLGDNFVVTAEGEVNIKKAFYYGSQSETKRTIGIKIKSSGEVLEQDVTISKATPKVDKLQLWGKDKTTPLKTISYETTEVGTGQAFNLTKLREKADVVATDQYGVQVVLKKDENLEFPDGTEIDTVLKFTTSSDGLIFTQNNTEEAAVTELPLGASFNTIIAADTIGTASSNTVVVTVAGEGHTPEAKKEQEAVEAAVEKIKNETVRPLTNNDNAIEILRNIVGEEYTVTIKSSNHPAIAKDGTVIQQASKRTVAVEFIVTKGKHSSSGTINLEVAMAPKIVKDSLEKAIADAKNASKDIKESSDGTDLDSTKEWTIPAVKAALDNAIERAEAVYISIAPQSEIDEAVKALEAATNLYERAIKKGTGPTGAVSGVTTKTPFVAETLETPAVFEFAVITALHEDDTLEIGAEKFRDVTDVTSIVGKINATSGVYTATVDSLRVVLTQKNATAGANPLVEITSTGIAIGEVGPVFNPIPYKAAKPATPAVFTFEVTKVLAEADTLEIGTETYSGVTTAASIVAKIKSSISKYDAEASGEIITLTQKEASAEVPTIRVRK